MNIKQYGKLSKAHVEKLGESWAIWAFSHKYKRNVNTHVFPEKQEALLTMQQMSK